MKKELKCVMLVDDDADDNFFHEREIKKVNVENIVIAENSAMKGLEYLRAMKSNKDPYPDLIFLDINMPRMNGWEFLQEYNRLDKELQSRAIIIMLTTSENPNDKLRAKTWDFVRDYISKPLTREIMREIIATHFN